MPNSEAQAARFSVRYRETWRLDKKKKGRWPPPHNRDEAEEGGAAYNWGAVYRLAWIDMILVSDILQGAKQWPESQDWLFPTILVMSPNAEIDVWLKEDGTVPFKPFL